jgi:hypothetical protein
MEEVITNHIYIYTHTHMYTYAYIYTAKHNATQAADTLQDSGANAYEGGESETINPDSVEEDDDEQVTLTINMRAAAAA